MAEEQRSAGAATDTPATPVQREGWPIAPLRRRFAALVVDWILCVLLSGFLGPIGQGAWPSLILVVEYAFFVGLFGQTPGMRAARIRCAPLTGTGVLGVPRALLRGLLLALVIPPLIMDKQQRGLHDRAVGSVMISS